MLRSVEICMSLSTDIDCDGLRREHVSLRANILHAHIHTCICLSDYLHSCLLTYFYELYHMQAYMYVYMSAYIYMYICIRIHNYTRIHNTRLHPACIFA